MKEHIIKVVVVVAAIFAISYLFVNPAERDYISSILISLYGLILIEYKDIKKIKVLIIVIVIIFYHFFLWRLFDLQNSQNIPQEKSAETISVQNPLDQ